MKTKILKLSNAQSDTLIAAVRDGRFTCYSGYQPVAKLVSLGFATSHEGRMGGHWIEPTDAGKKWVEQLFANADD